jgi:hypothetical protein
MNAALQIIPGRSVYSHSKSVDASLAAIVASCYWLDSHAGI